MLYGSKSKTKKCRVSFREVVKVNNSEHKHLFSFENFICEDDRKELVNFMSGDGDSRGKNFEWEHSWSWTAPLEQFNRGPVVLTGAYAEKQKELRAQWSENAVHPLMAVYGKKIMEIASDVYGRTLVHRLEPYLKKFPVGADHYPHCDREAMSGGVVDFMPNYSPDMFNTPVLIEYAANLYLNDDFEGGELFFPERNLSIKPKAGQLVLFPGGNEYIHGVKPVTSGERCVLFSPLTTPQLLLLHMHAYNERMARNDV